MTYLIEVISELCDIEIDGERVMIGWEDDGGGIIRLVMLSDDEKQAESIVKSCGSCRMKANALFNLLRIQVDVA